MFRSAPHATSSGREGVDALLAASAYSDDLCAIFIDDGVTQLISHQDTAGILSKNYAPMFKLFDLYDIEQVYVCGDSLKNMGFEPSQLIIEAEVLSHDEISKHLHSSRKLLSF